MIPPTCVFRQSLFDAINALLASRISSVGFANASVTPNWVRNGPSARTMIFLVEPFGPRTMKPSMSTLSPVPTGRRVATFATKPGVAPGVGEGPGVGVGVGLGVGVGAGPGTSELAIENSEVLPFGSVAVAVMNWPCALLSSGKLKEVWPCGSVCTYKKPMGV